MFDDDEDDELDFYIDGEDSYTAEDIDNLNPNDYICIVCEQELGIMRIADRFILDETKGELFAVCDKHYDQLYDKLFLDQFSKN